MGRFAPLLPELILSIGGTILMMVAAFTGRRGAGLTSWLAIALLLGATFALIGAPSHAGPIFDGIITADLFGAFGKAIMFPAAAVAIVAAHGWFERGTEHGAEYAVLIVFAAVGMSVMVSATSLISLYVGLELQSLAAYVLASYRRTDDRSAEAGLKYFVLGALASGILLYGISLLYGFTGTTSFTGLAAAGPQGASSVLFYMAVYVVMTLGAFLCVLWMRGPDGEEIESIESLSGLSQTRPAFAAAFAIFMFSLAGIPPLFGFWPKLMVFQAAVHSGYVALAVAGILGTVVGAYYYLRIVKVMYMDEPAAPYARRREPVQGALILLAAIIVSPLGYLLIQRLQALTDRA